MSNYTAGRRADVPPLVVQCGQCGGDYRIWPYELGASKFCSLACRNLGYLGRPTKPALTCAECGRQYSRSNGGSKFCSRECLHAWNKKRLRSAWTRRRWNECQMSLRGLWREPPHCRGEQASGWRGGMPTWTCVGCGNEFRAYRKIGGAPRRFCSSQCANEHHRQGGDDMRARYAFEYEAMDRLGTMGFSTFRSAGSRGPVDVFGVNGSEIRLVQVKSTKRPHAPGTVSMLADAAIELLAKPIPPNTSRWIWLRILHGPWLEWCVDGWPTGRGEIKDQIRLRLAELP